MLEGMFINGAEAILCDYEGNAHNVLGHIHLTLLLQSQHKKLLEFVFFDSIYKSSTPLVSTQS